MDENTDLQGDEAPSDAIENEEMAEADTEDDLDREEADTEETADD